MRKSHRGQTLCGCMTLLGPLPPGIDYSVPLIAMFGIEMEWPLAYARLISPGLQILVLAVMLYFHSSPSNGFGRQTQRHGAVRRYRHPGGTRRRTGPSAHRRLVAARLNRLAAGDSLDCLPARAARADTAGPLVADVLRSADARILVQIQEAVIYMSQRRIGALIVIERSDKLDDFMEGKQLDCDATRDALVTIFWKDTPLHDGAMIIRGGRIAAAGVVLPLTENLKFKDLSGTRHRAGIGSATN